MFKRLATIVLAFVMVLGLASCKASSKEDVSSKQKASSTVTDSVSSNKDATTSEDSVSSEKVISSKPVSSNNSTSSQSSSSTKPVSSVAVVSKIETPKKEYTLPKYELQTFEIAGLWAPRQMTEEAFLQYKNAGFNVFSFTNHDELPRKSENQYYIGSKRSLEALELCKKVGLDVYISYGDSWFNRHNEGDEYFEGEPFSKHNVYGEYMDIIKGMHVKDEPNKETMTYLSNDTLINDFKKVYGNRKYIINLIPETAVQSRDYENYTEMLEHFGEEILSKFEKPHISVDCYLHSNSVEVQSNIVNNYNQIANCAKKYGATTSMILQSSTGNEFKGTLTEADMRQQVYLALAFGADSIQYYCYSVPDDIPYYHCMLERDNVTPNQLYYDVKTVNEEIQKFSSVFLAYDWNQSIGISGSVFRTYRVRSIEYDENDERIKLKDAKHYVSAKSTEDLVVSHFTSQKYGEAYMFVNFSRDVGSKSKIDVQFKECSAVAVYGGAGYNGTPKIVELDSEGNFKMELAYGDGAFIVPLK